jgi:peroxiredoxin
MAAQAQLSHNRRLQHFSDGRMRIKHGAIALALVAVASVGAWVAWGTGGSAAPVSTFVLLDGTNLRTADLRGKVVLVNFWATSCTTCVAEMPDLVATHQKYQAQGFETLAVAMHYDPPSYVVNFVESRKLPFKVAIDNTGAVAKAWGDVKLTPTTYIVNKQGNILKSYVGPPNFDELHRLIEKLLAQG